MLVDSHCHLDRLDLTPFAGDFASLLGHCASVGVAHVLCVSIDWESYPAMRRLLNPYPGISVSLGVHPNEQSGHEPSVEELYEAGCDPCVIAIGETGLDFYRSAGDLTWQQERFRRHIRAARQLGKPLIVHTREAKADTLRILEEERAHEVGGVLHCFTEDWEMAERALALNFYISFSGIVTFNSAKTIQDVATRVPGERYLLETDAPYLAPVPHRGKPNYPYYVRHVAAQIAQLRGESEECVARQTTENFLRLFKLTTLQRLAATP